MTRRAWTLVLLNVLIPGSAQVLAGSRRLGRMVGVVRAMVMCSMFMGMMIRGMVMALGRRRAARETRMRAHERDQTRQDRADQRQEDDRLIHRGISPSSS